MSMFKASLLALMIPTALVAPTIALADGPMRGPHLSFEVLDADGSGALTLDELENAREAHFATADTDGNGSLSRDELIARGQAGAEARVDRLLERADADEDGSLTMAEMEEAGGRRGRRGPDPERMFNRFDANEDGSVTQEEFEQGIARMMERRGGGHNSRRGGDQG